MLLLDFEKTFDRIKWGFLFDALAQEALDWAIESDQDLVMLLLDFEKTFDMIKWGFLFDAMAKLGFASQ
jgi:hypothetical protein